MTRPWIIHKDKYYCADAQVAPFPVVFMNTRSRRLLNQCIGSNRKLNKCIFLYTSGENIVKVSGPIQQVYTVIN